MKPLFASLLTLTTISLTSTPALAETIPASLGIKNPMSTINKGRNKERQNSARLYVKIRVTPQKVNKSYLTKRGV